MDSDDTQNIDDLILRHLDGELTPAEGQQLSVAVVRDRSQARRLMRMSILNSQLRTMLMLDSGKMAEAPSVTLTPRMPVLGMPWRTGVMLFGLLIVSGLVSWISSKSSQDSSVLLHSIADEKDSFQGMSSVQLQSGTVKLKIPNVGFVTVDGPANFEMLSKDRARLENGRIRMRVTEETGRGFVVETPDGEITDLGTEFGVDVTSGKSSALAVFEGAVDLKIADLANQSTRVERLLGGDGGLFRKGGQLNRLNSIMTGEGAKFAVCGEKSSVSFDDPIIVDVYDSLPSGSTKRYYEIVPKGMDEDALAYVDRLEHNWNGLSKEWGMPRFLRGGDYVKTFCDDKGRTDDRFEMTVVLSRPAVLYVLTDRRLAVPEWLGESFERSVHRIGMDTGKRDSRDAEKVNDRFIAGRGPGDSIDLEFEIWKRSIRQPGPVKLGPNGKVWRVRDKEAANMYAIVAVESTPKGKVSKMSPKQNASHSSF